LQGIAETALRKIKGDRKKPATFAKAAVPGRWLVLRDVGSIFRSIAGLAIAGLAIAGLAIAGLAIAGLGARRLRCLRRQLALGFLQCAVNLQLNPADRQKVDPGLRPAGLHLIADPELPFPDARRFRQCQAVIDTFVVHGIHGNPPKRDSLTQRNPY
jgi:hypothetical protein